MKIHSGRQRFIATFCAGVLLLQAAPGLALARDKSLGWENVMNLRAGSPVIVTMTGNLRYQGRVAEAVKEKQLILKVKSHEMTIAKSDITSVMTYRPIGVNPGTYIMAGGALLGGVGGLAGSVKDINTLNSGSLPKGNSGQTAEIAGIATAVAGLAVYILVGKPRIIYQSK